MRSSKSRSRSKPNRPRTLGNIINRVFDSSGPEGKVRGTPQQLIEKYQQLGRDAQLSNDRVAAENFMQHSEHYTRLLAEAQREMAAEQDARQAQQQQNGNGNSNGGYSQPRNDRPEFRNDRGDGGQQPRFDQPRNEGQPRNDGQRNDGQRNDGQPRNDGQRNDGQRSDQSRNDGQRNDGQRSDPSRQDNSRHDQQRNDQPRQDNRPEPRHDQRPDRRDDRRVVPADIVTFAEVDEDTGLVETPEARRALPVVEEPPVTLTPDDLPTREENAKRARAPRRPRAPADGDAPTPAPEKPTRTRGPAKPREAAE